MFEEPLIGMSRMLELLVDIGCVDFHQHKRGSTTIYAFRYPKTNFSFRAYWDQSIKKFQLVHLYQGETESYAEQFKTVDDLADHIRRIVK